MPHPFEVGKTYRNRVGEYVVVSIDEPQIKIRYLSGGTLTTDIKIQARIWENIQFEEQMARAEERRQQALEAREAARAKIREAKARPVYAGFRPEDFEPKKRGVVWTERKPLGRAVAYYLGRHAKQAFDHWLVPRQSAVHVARKDAYDRTAPDGTAAFFCAVSESGVACGLNVSRPEGKAQPDGPWSRLVAALAGDEALRQAVQAVMEKHNLGLDLYAMQVSYGQVARVTLQEGAGTPLLWREEAAQQVVERPMSWEDLLEAVRSLAPGKRAELNLCRHLSAEEALAPGPQIVQHLVAVLVDLLPLYEACLPG